MMLKNRQSYYQNPSRFNMAIYLATSTLIFATNSTVCHAFSNTNISEPSSISSPNSNQISTDLVISQGIINIEPFVPVLEASPAFLEIIPGIMPMSVYEEPSEAPVSESSYDTGFAPEDASSGSLAPSVRALFSLKSVRQSVNIALPNEAEIPSLPQLAFDKMHPGVAGEADLEINGRRVDFYQFEGNQDQQIVVVLRNSQDARPDGLRLMPYMMVFDPNRQVMAATVVPGSYRIPTDDPLLPLDNQLALRLPQSGRYVVAVFTNPGEVGRYGIGWKQDETRFRYDEIHELTNVGTAESVEIPGKTGQTVQIQAISHQFDPVVTLVDANGNVIAEDDDNGGNYNARINITLPADGIYRASVTSTNGQGGQYRLRIR